MLPPSWLLDPDPATTRRDAGRVLLGGTPFRVWRLNERAARLVDRLFAGEPIGEDDAMQALARRLLDAGMAHPRPTPSPRSRADVTVVVPFFGPPAELADTLDALKALGSTGPVIVVDDGSPDPAVGTVAAGRGARVERHATNRGPGAARNTGWGLAETDVVAFVDGGCRPEPGWLEALLPHLDDPQVAAVAPRVTSAPDAALPPALAAYERARPTLDRGPAPASVRPGSRVPFVPSTVLIARRADLAAVGGFDEALRWGEDVDLVWRLVDAGHTVRYEPATVVEHGSRPTTRSWLRQRFDYGNSAAPLARRHGDAVRPVAVAPRVAAAWALGAGASVPAGLLWAGGTTAALAHKLDHLPHQGREAVRLSLQGHAFAGLAAADALRRPWWPLLAVAAVASRRARVVAALAAVVPPAIEWARDRPPLDPVRWWAFRLVDDLAYGAGVWAGCVRERSASCLRPAGRGAREGHRARRHPESSRRAGT
jgi:mycofactocin system glycosyltransferase